MDDLVVFVVSECFAVPLNIAAGEAFVAGHLDRAALGWGIGVPLAVAGFTYHWFKKWISAPARDSIQFVARYGWPVVLLLVFAYVAGPEMYRRATSPRDAPSPQPLFTQEQVDEKIKSATLSIKDQLSAAARELDDTRHQLESVKRNPATSMPPPPPNATDDHALIQWEPD